MVPVSPEQNRIVILLAILLGLAPVHRTMPLLDSFFPSHSWNAGSVVLAAVLASYYGIALRHGYRVLDKNSARVSLLLTTVLLSTALVQLGAANVGEVARLGLLIWLIPLVATAKNYVGSTTLSVLLVAVLSLHATWGIGQFIVQRDLGLTAIGESVLTIGHAGVSTFSSEVKLLRAYGPYPHPNILAGSAALSISQVLFLTRRRGLLLPLRCLLVLLSLALLLTFSRAGLSAALVAGGVWLWQRRGTTVPQAVFTRTALVLAITGALLLPLWHDRLTDTNDRAAVERVAGVTYARDLLAAQPWRGVGIGNYETALDTYLTQHQVPHQPWWSVPVHSVPLLLLTEWGLFGAVILLISGGYAITRAIPPHRRWWLLPLLPLLLVDHYLLTETAPQVLVVVLLLVLTAPRNEPQSASRAPVLPALPSSLPQ